MACSMLLVATMEARTYIQSNTTIRRAIHGHLFQPQWKLVAGKNSLGY